jgi:hypothetical protein
MATGIADREGLGAREGGLVAMRRYADTSWSQGAVHPAGRSRMGHTDWEAELVALLEREPGLVGALRDRLAPAHLGTGASAERLRSFLVGAAIAPGVGEQPELDYLAEQVRRMSRARHALAVVHRLERSLRQDPSLVDTCVAEAVGSLVAGAMDGPACGAQALNPGVASGPLQTGLADLDRRLGGLQRRQLTVLAARPAMGRTSLALQFAAHALGEGKRVVLFSMGRPAGEVVEHFACLQAGVVMRRAGRGALGREDLGRLTAAVAAVSEAPLMIDERQGLNIAEVVAGTAAASRALGGVDLVLVDGLESLLGSGRARAIADLADLRAVAVSLSAAVLAVGGLTRAIEKRADKRPRITDLRARQALQRHASAILSLYRPEYYGLCEEAPGFAELLWWQGDRMGCQSLHFDAPRLRFGERPDCLVA